MEVVIVRLPLTYGSGVKANFSCFGWGRCFYYRTLTKNSLSHENFFLLPVPVSLLAPGPQLNQHDLIELRPQKGLHKLLPGITGWAQVNGGGNIYICFKKLKGMQSTFICKASGSTSRYCGSLF